jgi:hypothetical protein
VTAPARHRLAEVEPYVGKHRAPDWDDTDFVPSPVPRLRGCAPAWPDADVDADAPTVEFRPVSRWSRFKARMSWQRQVAGGMSGLVLLATLYGWVNQ